MGIRNHEGTKVWRTRRLIPLTLAVVASAALGLSGCSGSGGSSPSDSASGDKIPVALILKERANPYYAFMEKALEKQADELGIDLTVLVGSSQTDTAAQINQIEDAVSAGNKGILITVDGDAVNSALDAARDAGVIVVALDTAPNPLDTADISYLTDPLGAGEAIGTWQAAKLDGGDARIALLDGFANVVVAGDVQRNHGFLQGMGIPVGDPNLNGKEPLSGDYTGGKGGSYVISCQATTEGTIDGGKSAMETCLSKDPDINVVYSVNEPAGVGALQALADAGNKATLTSIDGSCENLKYVADGSISATAGQLPGKMAELGAKAVVDYVKNGTKPQTSPGLDFFDTGVTLYTDDPQDGVESITTAEAADLCW